jgi:ligand-binding sensor domain-containing protein
MKSILFILFLSSLMLSCNGQIKTGESQNKPLVKDTTISKSQPLATQNSGLPYLHTSIKDPLFYIDGQLCQHLRKIYQDKRGNLWFGTNVYGIIRYDGDKLQYFDKKDGVIDGRITAILEDKEGNVWFGSAGGLLKFDGEKFSSFTEEDELFNAEIWSIYLDNEGDFWIGTTNGVNRFDGKEFSKFPIQRAKVKDAETVYSFERITHILKDKEGSMWFGTDGYGITKYDGTHFTYFTKENGLCDNNISEMMMDSQGNIWIGTYFGGVSMYDGKTFTNFTANGTIEGIEVGAFFEDKKGTIWFAAENHGVYSYNGKSFTIHNAEQGLNTNGVLSIYQDKEDRFWFGGWGGLFRYDGTSFTSVTSQGPWK